MRMSKQIPISEELRSYFTDPCPVLSTNNVEFIIDEMNRGHDWVVEYGLGASTLYFLKQASPKPKHMISVENNYDWFEICVQEITKQLDLKEQSAKSVPWSLKAIKSFATGKSDVDVPENLKRFPKWQESLPLGPFFRFSPLSNSRFSGKFGPLWQGVKPILKLGATLYYTMKPNARPYNAEWIGASEGTILTLRNIGPSIKDQFGEAPNKDDYINAGLKDIRAKLEEGGDVKALFLIDGGPRHHIVQEILNLEDQYAHFSPTIVLCDACRAFYHDTLSQRGSGKFYPGTNQTLKGARVIGDISGLDAKFWVGGDKTANELAEKEVWYYKRDHNLEIKS